MIFLHKYHLTSYFQTSNRYFGTKHFTAKIFAWNLKMKCSFCKEEGHSIKRCQAPGAREEKLRRKSDPKAMQAREAAKKKHEEKAREEMARLRITKEKKSLHQPVIKPGHLNLEYVSSCETVQGVLEVILPTSYLQKILDILNTNRFPHET